MARTMAAVKVTIWTDEAFTGLSADAQRVYLLVLSQARVSLAGHIDYMPSRWANLARDSTTGDIETAIVELEQTGFVAVDRVTEELVIRSFIAHDIGANYRRSSKIGKGLWAAWEGILSAKLRALVVRSAPDEVWSDLEPTAPAAAVEIRRSAHIEPEPPVPIETDPPVHTDSPEPEPEPEPHRAPAAFDRFWTEYPIKRDKKNARKAFDRALADGTDPNEIIEGARRYAAKVSRERIPEHAIKYPQGWLNDERWTENLPPVERIAVDEVGGAYTSPSETQPGMSLSVTLEELERQEAEDEKRWQEYLAKESAS